MLLFYYISLNNDILHFLLTLITDEFDNYAQIRDNLIFIFFMAQRLPF